MNRFFVEYKLHNKVNGGWAYQTVKSDTDYDTCLKTYHKTCADYIGGDTFDHVCITIEDAFGNVIKKEVWDAPASIVEPEVSETQDDAE